MKKSILVLICIFFLAYNNKSIAQCPTCNINTSFTASGIYPNPLPDATQGQPYSQDETFVMFLDTSGYTVNYFKILAITGLPLGMSWQCNNSSTNCQYDPAVNIRGCVKICGTPLQAGNFTVTVSLILNLQTVGNYPATQIMNLHVNPAAGGNSGFSFTPAQACDSATVQFQALINGAPSPTSYSWTFGNGNTSTLQNPPAQQYTSPGDYVVTLQTNILGYKVTAVNLASVATSVWCGDTEEPSCTFNNPDPFFTITNSLATSLHTSSTVGDALTATWNGLDVTLNDPPYTISFTDYDAVSVNDALGSFPFNVSSTGSIPFSSPSGTSGSITIDTYVIQTFTDHDTVRILEVPPAINCSIVGNDSVCFGDSIQLVANGLGSNLIQWYNDTTFIVNENSSNYIAKQSGDYWAKITNSLGCTSETNHQLLTIFPAVPSPTIAQNVNTLTCNSPGYQYQWFLDGGPIAGANSVTYTITQNGNYSVSISTPFGCTALSGSPFVTFTGIEEIELLNSINIYPNPVEDELNLMLTEKLIGYRYTLTDCIGKTMQQGLINEIKMKLTLNEYKQGVYFLTIEGSAKKTFKVIKN